MILAIVQARVSSSRLPGKVLLPILGKPMLARQIERVQRARRIDHIVVATSSEPEDDVVASLCVSLGVGCFRGSLDDVLDRFYQAARPHRPECVVRLTGDCPLIDPDVVDATIRFCLVGGYEYASNCQPPYTFPDGLDTEVFTFSSLETAWREAVLPSHREHVTPFISRNPARFSIGHYTSSTPLGHLRWTVDEPEDFELATKIYEALYSKNPAFTTDDVLQLLDERSDLRSINSHIARNEGKKKSLEADRTFFDLQKQ